MYMTTYSGNVINLLSPKQEDFDIDDIALGLSNVCRFSGQVGKFYSVAEHSVNVSILSKMIADKTFDDPRRSTMEAFNGVMHDASEAYLCDLITPVKHMMPDYMLIESNFMNKISEKYGFFFCEENGLTQTVHIADKVALLIEADHLISSVHKHRIFDEVSKDKRVKNAYDEFKDKIEIYSYDPPTAKRKFLHRWYKLNELLNTRVKAV